MRATIPDNNLLNPKRPSDPRFGPLATALANPFVNMRTQANNYASDLNDFVGAVAKARTDGTVRFSSELAAALAAVNRPLPTRASAV